VLVYFGLVETRVFVDFESSVVLLILVVYVQKCVTCSMHQDIIVI